MLKVDKWSSLWIKYLEIPLDVSTTPRAVSISTCKSIMIVIVIMIMISVNMVSSIMTGIIMIIMIIIPTIMNHQQMIYSYLTSSDFFQHIQHKSSKLRLGEPGQFLTALKISGVICVFQWSRWANLKVFWKFESFFENFGSNMCISMHIDQWSRWASLKVWPTFDKRVNHIPIILRWKWRMTNGSSLWGSYNLGGNRKL